MGNGGWWLGLTAFAREKSGLVGGSIVAVMMLVSLLGGALAPYDPYEQALAMKRYAPSGAHPFGFDEFGRDILSRMLVGSRFTFLSAVLAVVTGTVLGAPLGIVAAYFEGRLDRLLSRAADGALAFPYFLVAIVLGALTGPSIQNAIVAVGVASFPRYFRVARGATLTVRRAEFVEGARALGSSDLRILARQILPNVAPSIIVMSTVGMSTAVLGVAALGFLGLGAQPPVPEWGAMLGSGRIFLRDAPHMAIFPGVGIMLLAAGFNLLGDAFRDLSDPRLS